MSEKNNGRVTVRSRDFRARVFHEDDAKLPVAQKRCLADTQSTFGTFHVVWDFGKPGTFGETREEEFANLCELAANQTFIVTLQDRMRRTWKATGSWGVEKGGRISVRDMMEEAKRREAGSNKLARAHAIREQAICEMADNLVKNLGLSEEEALRALGKHS